jgi:hypothetical protein
MGSAIQVGAGPPPPIAVQATVKTCSVTVAGPAGSPLRVKTDVWSGTSGIDRCTVAPVGGVTVITAQRASVGASVRFTVVTPVGPSPVPAPPISPVQPLTAPSASTAMPSSFDVLALVFMGVFFQGAFTNPGDDDGIDPGRDDRHP